ncbi:MAG: hypothetical protein AAB874_07845, partial [Patescibacteria group bacterium]
MPRKESPIWTLEQIAYFEGVSARLRTPSHLFPEGEVATGVMAMIADWMGINPDLAALYRYGKLKLP